ncbi:hypothetical protein RRG08_062110 [Elysia crispata]|uniref:C-type lectin domain-containing protein n=1 Tax=Elysia crispata TaxID=231223 RepID=A0AAE0ZJ35_9GAST|nr:hypothetical protein RRG08_062110 [Elysia crispata]
MITLILATLVVSASATFCSDGWIESIEPVTCIKMMGTDKTWQEARTACKSLGGDLVKIVNKRMNDFVYAQIQSHGRNRYWIGLRLDERGNMRWLDEHDEQCVLPEDLVSSVEHPAALSVLGLTMRVMLTANVNMVAIQAIQTHHAGKNVTLATTEKTA